MLELFLDVLFASLFIYVYFSQAQESQAPQAEQEVSERAKVYQSFWYGDDEDGELYVTQSAPEKMLSVESQVQPEYDVDEPDWTEPDGFPHWYDEPDKPYVQLCECCGEVEVDYTVDDWCFDCNQDAEVYEYTTAYRDGELEGDDECVDWDFMPVVNNYQDDTVPVFTVESLEGLSIRELKRIASANKLPRYGDMTKAQLKEGLYALKF